MSDFFHMGGYGLYIWGSYGLACLLMIVVFAASWLSWRRNERTLAALKSIQSASPGRGAPHAGSNAGRAA